MTIVLISGLGGFVACTVLIAALWRRREEPTALPLLGVALFAWVAIVATFGVLEIPAVHTYATAVTGLDGQSWLLPAFVYPIIALGLWVIFAFQYTGRGDRMTVVTFILVGTLISLILGPLAVDAVVGFEPALAVSNFSTFVASFVMAALSFVSVLLIVDESLRIGGYRVIEALVLGGGVLALAFAPLAGTVTQQPASFFSLVGTSSLLFLIAVVPLSLFSVLPVARVVGRNQVINELDAAVVVIDGEQRIRDLNPAGEELFGTDRDDTLGKQLSTLFPQQSEPPEHLLSHEESQQPIRFADGRTVTVTVDPVTDARGNQFGQLLLFQDVTDRRERERRLGVLNQLLIGTLREQMDVVRANASDIRSSGQQSETRKQLAESIWADTTELIELADRAREIERTLSDTDDREALIADSIHRFADERALRVETEECSGNRSLSGVTPSQFDLLLELAMDMVAQENDYSELKVVDSDATYSLRWAEEQDCTNGFIGPDSVGGNILSELVLLVADHLSVTIDSYESSLLVELSDGGNERDRWKTESSQ